MSIRPPDIDQIICTLTQALSQIPDQQGIFSISIKSALFDQQNLPHLSGNWFYWAQPNQSTYLLGVGEALRLSGDGGNRLTHLVQQYELWSKQWSYLDLSETNPKRITFTGFAFDANDPMEEAWQDWPNAAIFFPEVLIQNRGTGAVLSFTSLMERRDSALLRWRHQLEKLATAFNRPLTTSNMTTDLSRTSTRPSDEEWIDQINQATKQIKDGKLHKVVPFRRISVKANHPLNPARLMANLDRNYSSSLHFSTHLNGLTFAAVTPERLIKRNGLEIHCDAIGGTTRRDPATNTDTELGHNLLNDTKCRYEHALVVKNIHQTLAPLCQTLDRPREPALLKLPNLQHLWTEFKGTLKRETNLLKLGQKLHPTAAVNGYPSADAGEWLSTHASSRRGWYSGAAGWLDSEGSGELAVLLRCALLRGDSADLFAGAGITDASEPQSELQETELKFHTMLQALQHATE